MISGIVCRNVGIGVVVTLLAAPAFAAPAPDTNCDALPATNVEVSYATYYESDSLPDDEPMAHVIDVHLALAQNIFQSTALQLKFIGTSAPQPAQLRPGEVELVRNLLAEMVSDDPETAVNTFKTLATDSGIYEKDRLNVYYIDVADLTGVHLRNREGYSHDIIIMGLGFEPETLAHELSHAFSLAHVNFWTHDDPDLAAQNGEDGFVFPNGVQVEYCAEYEYFNNACNFSNKNLMWAARKDRDALTTGQVERMACNETSALINNGDLPPTTWTIECPSWSAEGNCPRLAP